MKRRKESGQSMIEFAFIMPLVVFMVLGFIEMLLVYHDYTVVTNAVRDGAHIASLGGSDTETRSRMYNSMVGSYIGSYILFRGDLGGGAVINPPDTASDSRVEGEDVTVTIPYRIGMHIPLLGTWVVSLPASSTMRITNDAVY